MDLKKFVLAGILGGIALFVVSTIVGMLVQAVLPYDVLALGGTRPVQDPVMLLFFAHAWVISFTMAALYPYVKGSLKGSLLWKGKKFGLLAWLVSSLPSAFVVYTSMDYPIGFTINQLAGSLLYMVAAGIVIAKLME